MNNAKNTTLFPYLERLLEGEAVEWKTLGEVGTFVRGTSFQKKHFVEKGIGCIHYGEIYTRYGLFAKKTISYLDEEIANKARKAAYGDLIIATTSENDDDVCKSTVWLGTESIVVSNDACYYHHTLNPKYVAYFFRTNEFQKQKRAYITGTKVKRVNANDLAKITIPVPPLRVQARIVEILDKFTQLEAELEKELEAELEARKKQYAYYRDQLLNFSQYPPLNVNTEWKTLGEVCSILRGRRLTKKQLSEEGKYPVFHGGLEPIGYYDESNRKGDTTMVINVGASAGTIGYSQNDFWSSDGCFCISDTPLALSRFIFYVLQSKELQIKGKVRKAGIPTLDSNILEQLPIPLPPLSEQRRIVDILDRFDTLTNSISEGLPKEIVLRRKQYEYYRDALLNFPRAEVTA